MEEGSRFYIRNQYKKGGGGGGIDVLISLHKTMHTRAFPMEGSQERAKKLALIRNDLE